jgi:hypothetical protein
MSIRLWSDTWCRVGLSLGGQYAAVQAPTMGFLSQAAAR